MPVELIIPSVGESITEVQVGRWLKAAGDAVKKDEPLVEIETDKVTQEISAPADGVLSQIVKPQGSPAVVGDVVGLLAVNGESAASPAPEVAKPTVVAASPAAKMPETPAKPSVPDKPAEGQTPKSSARKEGERAFRKDAVETAPSAPAPTTEIAPPVVAKPPAALSAPSPAAAPIASSEAGREEEVVAMTPLRRRIAQRLVEAQQAAALLTTFNEIDMSSVMTLRKQLQETFQEKHGVKLGFMSFFIKASISALKLVPQVNAEVRGNHIVYKNYYDIGVAIGGGKGLVVPVLRNAERLGFAGIESKILDFANRAKDGKLDIEELQGGTFTISNGGVYGSLLSTPIINPPQSGILGLHTIQERPIALNGQVVIRPMMYIALTYDHRIVDGREAVTFLKHVKEMIETPARMLVEA